MYITQQEIEQHEEGDKVDQSRTAIQLPEKRLKSAGLVSTKPKHRANVTFNMNTTTNTTHQATNSFGVKKRSESSHTFGNENRRTKSQSAIKKENDGSFGTEVPRVYKLSSSYVPPGLKGSIGKVTESAGKSREDKRKGEHKRGKNDFLLGAKGKSQSYLWYRYKDKTVNDSN